MMNRIANYLARTFGVDHMLTPVPRPVLYYSVQLYCGPRVWRVLSEHRSEFVAKLFASDARKSYGESRVQIYTILRLEKT